MVHLRWGTRKVDTETVFLPELPRKGEPVTIEVRNTAEDPKRWIVRDRTIKGVVTDVKHMVLVNYGDDVGPHSLQSVEVIVSPYPYADETKN